MSPVIVETTEKLLARRQEILRDLGMSLEQFREVADTVTLAGDKLDMLEELDEIAFLLGDAA